MTDIDRLNRRLGEALGTIGGTPRFAWKWAPDLFYFVRDHVGQSFVRYTWADRLGKVWLLAERRGCPTMFDPSIGTLPITKEMWWHAFHGALPYPDADCYSAFAETAFQPGLVPDAEDTQKVIASLRRQMEMTYADHMREINAGLEQDRLNHQKDFFARVEEDFPSFWKNGQGHEPGTRGAHVSLPYTAQDAQV